MRFIAFARQARSALTFVARRIPAAFTLAERLFVYRSAYRDPGDHSAGFERIRLELVPLEARQLLSGTPVPGPIVVAAAAGQVYEYDASTGGLNFSVTPYAGYTGPVNVAVGDLNGDGFPDLVTAEGAGGEPLVRVFDGRTGDPLSGAFGGFLAFEPTYTGGVRVAVADVNGDGTPDVIAAAQRAGGAEVRVFSGANGSVLADFTVTGAAFASGFSLAAGDFTGSGRADVVAGGTGGWVAVYNPLGGTALSGPLGAFQAFGPGYTGGVVSVAADPLAGVANPGAASELAVATGAGPTTEVKVFNAAGAVVQDLEPFGASDAAGAAVALAYVSDPADPTVPDVVVGSGAGDADAVRVFSGTTGDPLAAPTGAYTWCTGDASGVDVAAGNDPTITVTVGPTTTTTVGPTGTASIGTLVWYDTNDDTADDDGESGAAGVTVVLTGEGVDETQVTNASGHYDFTGLEPGTYTVAFTEPEGYTFSTPSDGVTVQTVAAGETDTAADAGLYADGTSTASIGTHVWYDTNHDAVSESSEYGAAGITVTLTGASLTAAETATTDASGDYDFTGLAAGTYTVSFAAPEGYVFSTPSDGELVQTVTAGEADTAASAGLVDGQTTTSVVADPDPSLEGEEVTLTARVTPANELVYPPSGEVVFTDGGVTLGTAALNEDSGDDEAVLTTTDLPVGTSTVIATYEGDSIYEPSSGTTTVTVTALSDFDLNADVPGDDPDQGGYLLPLGEAQVDLNRGAVRVTQALDFAQSDFGRADQSFALVYNGATVSPLLVEAELDTEAAAGTPTAIYATLVIDGTAGPPISIPLTGYVPGDPFALPPLLVPPLSTGVHTWELEVEVELSGSVTVTETDAGTVTYVNRVASPYGSGWGVSGVDQLVPTTAGVLWVDGAGDARLFAGTGTYTSPAGDYGTLVAGGGGYTYTARDGDVEVFNGAGEETALTHPTGLGWTFTYTAAGGLSEVTAVDGGQTTFSYSGTSGLLSGIAEPGARALAFAETGTDLTGITDVDGSARTLGYSGTTHRLDSDDWAPWAAAFGYDADGQLDAADFGAGAEEYTIAPADAAGAAALTDGDGDVTAFALDALGRLLDEDQPGGVDQAWAYTTGGEVSAYTDARGQTTQYVYASGQLTGVTNPNGSTESYTYGAVDNNLSEGVDEDGDVTTYRYDGDGDLTSETAGAGTTAAATTSYTWLGGLLRGTTDPDGNTTSDTYNGEDQLTAQVTTASSGAVVGDEAFTRNGAGFLETGVVGVGAAGAATTSYAYDGKGQLLGQTNPAGDASSYTYAPAGDLLYETDGDGVGTEYVYNGADEQTEEIGDANRAAPETRTFTFDPAGNETRAVDPDGNYAVDTYNAEGWVLTADTYDANGTQIGSQADTYDADGDVLTATDGDGNVTRNTYDDEDRLLYTELDTSLGPVTAQVLTYDNDGNVLTDDAGLGETIYTYDADGRVRSTTLFNSDGTGGVLSTDTYAYDGDGNVLTDTDGDGNMTSYTYVGDELTSMKVYAGTSLITSGAYSYDRKGNEVTSTDGNGNVTSYTFDGDGDVLSAVVKSTAGATVSSDTDTYDGDGNVLTDTDGDGNVTSYTYDANDDVLTRVVKTAGGALVSSAAYTYDGDGDELTETDYASAGAVGTKTSYTYDGDGDVLTVRAYDGSGALIGSQTDVYDEDGNVEQSKDGDGNTTLYGYLGNEMVQEVVDNSSGALVTASGYQYGTGGQLVASQVGNQGYTLYYPYIGDEVGEVAVRTHLDLTSPVVSSDSYTYDEDENVTSDTDGDGNVTSYTYVGDRVVSETVRAGTTLAATTSYTYDGDGDVLTAKDPNGNTTSYAYNADGDVLSTVVKNAGGTTVSSDTDTYDEDDNVLTDTDGDGNVTSYTYVGDRVTYMQTTDPSGHLVSSTSYTYDAEDDVTSETDALGNVTSYTYDGGRLMSETVRAGTPLAATTSYTYDEDGNIATVADPDGNTTSYAYSDDLQTSETVRGASGAVVRSSSEQYDAAGDLTESTDGDGNVTTDTFVGGRVVYTQTTDPSGHLVSSTSYTYDTQDNVISETDALGNVTSYTYAGGRLASETVRAGTTLAATTSYTYDGDDDVLTAKDPNGNVTSYTYNAGGDVLSTVVKNAAGVTVSSDTDTYDGDDNVLTDKDGDGNTTTNTYDGGRLTYTQTTDPSGHLVSSTSYTYDADDNVLTETDALGVVMSYTYAGSRLASETVRAGTTLAATTSYTYDGDDDVTSATDPNGNTTSYTYNADGDVLSTVVRNAAGATVTSDTDTYDGDDNVLTDKDGDGNTTTNTYDGGRLTYTQTTDPSGHLVSSTSYTYDADDNVLTETDALGDVTRNVYTGDRLASQTVGYGTTAAGTTSYTYDGDDNVATITDPDGNVTSFTYNASGQVLTTTSPLGTTSNTYDLAGNLTSTADPDGRKITSVYDGDELTTQTWYNASGTVTDTKTYTYDADGDMVSAGDASGAYTWTYAGDRVATQKDPNGITLTYTYDGDDNVTGLRDSQGGSTTMAYNADDQITSEVYQNGTVQLRDNVGYDQDGNVTSETRYSNAAGTGTAVGTTTYTYDGDENTGITATDATGGVVSSYSYTYNAGGEVATQVANGTTTTYGYDATGELTRAGTATYAYDANGNDANTGDRTGTDNELSSDGTWNYVYDADGDLVTQTGVTNGLSWTYTYNDANQLTSAVEASSGTVVESARYAYDVLGNLASESVTASGTTTGSSYAYTADGTLYADVGTGGTITTRYVSGVGGADTWMARVTSSGGSWLLSDDEGSVTRVVGLTGGVQDAITYDAWGNIISETAPSARGELGYQGGRSDAATGNWLFGAREYSPTRHDWTTQDPTGFGGGDSNLQRFVDNGPTDGTDPSGLADEAPYPREAKPSIIIKNADGETLNSIKIAKYWNSLTAEDPRGGETFPLARVNNPTDFVDVNPDRFYITVRDRLSWDAGVKITTAAIEIEGPNGKTSTKVPLVRSINEAGMYTSDSELLTSIKSDTSYSSWRIGNESDYNTQPKAMYTYNGVEYPLSKRVHYAGLGSKIQINYMGRGAGAGGVISSANMIVPARKIVKLNVVIVQNKDTTGKIVSPHTLAQVKDDIEWARQIYAQAGISIELEGNIREEEPTGRLLKQDAGKNPNDSKNKTWQGASTNGTDGSFKLNINDEVKMLIDQYKSNTPGVINVFYLYGLSGGSDGVGAQAYADAVVTEEDKKNGYSGAITIGSIDFTNYGLNYRMSGVLAHEIGHLLDNRQIGTSSINLPDEHFPLADVDKRDSTGEFSNKYNLMYEGLPGEFASKSDGLGNRVRLTEAQSNRMLTTSRYVATPTGK